ncbi:Bug family tripartite tricarboxylate transporter substrate binding protein [Falsiroseomonas sp. CW058]|uniref:Bug family tripartite tricarboxylate transporter substrate binding protein n=1 Tax=Falsiroseomonas sp. CW058 TaxID=3388664 RepID=UPI003D315877
MPTLTRRAALALPATLAAAPAVRAQSRTITLICPFGPGTNVDQIARLIAPELSQRLERQVVVENVTGAGGTIATERAARAAPDGSTLLLGVESTMVVAQLVTPSTTRYDGQRDFVPVHMVATLPLLLVGKPGMPATFAELVAASRAQPNPFNFGSSGTGTSLHLFGELLVQRAGLRMEHVPYRMGAQMLTDVMGGQLDLAVSTLTSSAPMVREGKARGYGVSSPERHPFLPDMPTFAEQPQTRGLAMEVWQAIFAPARTDPALVARVAQAASAAMASEELQRRIRDIGQTPSRMDPEALGAFVREEGERYAALVRAANIQPQ